MTFDDFKPLIKLYHTRYGKHSMDQALAETWHKYLKLEDFTHVQRAIESLIGARDKAFGWKAVVELINAKYKADDETTRQERVWKDDPKYRGNEEKRKAMNDYMRDVLPALKKRNPVDWMKGYVAAYIEIFGRDEADRVARGFALGGNDVERKFAQGVREALR